MNSPLARAASIIFYLCSLAVIALSGIGFSPYATHPRGRLFEVAVNTIPCFSIMRSC